MSTVVIIGGGIAGLASAALLAREGHTVTLLEGRPDVGGRAGSWDHDGFRFDTGPSWYLMPEVFDHFYKLLGTTAEEQLHLITLDPGYRVFFEGVAEPVDISAEVEENIALFEGIEKGAGARLAAYLESAREVYELAKARFLYTTFADFRPLLKKDVLGQAGRFVKLLLQPLSSFVKHRFRDIRLQQVLGYPAVFLGSSPYLTPSMYHLMSHLDLADGVLYPMGGFTRVIESIADLARAEGVTIVTSAEVTRIVVDGGKATGVTYLDGDRHVQFVDADIVVSAADLHHTETKLLIDGERTYPQEYWDSKTPGPSALLLYLGVEGELPELEHHNLLFTRDWKQGFDAIFGAESSVPEPASLYVCKPSGVDPDVAPEGFENLFVLVPIPADPTIGRGDVDGDGDTRLEVMADKVIAQISEWTGIPDLADRITVRRTVGPGNFEQELNAWRGTALGPAHTLKQSAFFRAGNVSKKVKDLYYVGGSTIPGIGLPMCLISAELLVKRLRHDVSTGPLPEPLEASPPVTLLYLAALLIALTGMVVLDRRFRLFFWNDARRAAIVLLAGVAFFLIWDFAGVGGGIFFRGETAFMTGLQIAPEIPLEEVFFLTLLCYLTMNVYGFASPPENRMTYWTLNAIFLAVILVVAILARRRVRWPAVGITTAILLIMTAVFDNIMISIGLVAYNESLISGAFIGVAPLEDFAYTIAAVVGLPSLWVLLDRRRRA